MNPGFIWGAKTELLEENIGENLGVLGIGKHFKNRAQSTKKYKLFFKEFACGKISNFWFPKETVQKIKIQTTNWKKILAIYIFDRGFLEYIKKY